MSVPFFDTPDGQSLPFVSNRLHSVNGERVPQTMLFPSREMIEEQMRAVPMGQTADLAFIRTAMAAEQGAATTCPVTTQRLLREIAEVSVDAWRGGDKHAVPFWRVIDPATPNAARLAGGADFIRDRRAAEERR